MENKDCQFEIIIIGAGMAGLAAARKLFKDEKK